MLRSKAEITVLRAFIQSSCVVLIAITRSLTQAGIENSNRVNALDLSFQPIRNLWGENHLS